MSKRLRLPRALEYLPDVPFQAIRFLALFGGRSGGKSESVARTLVWVGSRKKLFVVCLRQVQNSIGESSKATLENAIRELGLDDHYRITRNEIVGRNGTRFIFRGLSKATQGNLRSIPGLDIAWVEEAQDITEDSYRDLTPTMRKTGSQIWLTFNPKRPTDIVYRMFISEPVPPPRSVIHKVNYYDNPFATAETHEEAAYDKLYHPDEYRHVWLGELAPDLGVRRVLLMDDLVKCEELYDRYKHLGEDVRPFVGLDIADAGPDMNAMAVRRGPCLTELDVWRGGGGSTLQTTQRADSKAVAIKAIRLFYDEGGVGYGVRQDLTHIVQMNGRRPYQIVPVKFGESPMGPDELFDRRLTNREVFALRNSQLAWAVKQRAHNTTRLANGESVDPRDCLFINPAIRKTLATKNVLEQLNQPVWDDGDSGKIKIDKKPDDMPSPDMFDAVCLVFAEDSRNGLRQHRLA